MKSPVLIALLFALTTPMLSSEIPENSCREFNFLEDESLSASELARIDLLNGIWVKKDLNSYSETTFHFNETGSVDIIFDSNQSLGTYTHAHWEIEEHDQQAFLIWKEHNEKERLLKIDQTCDGLILTNILNAKSYSLIYLPKAKREKLISIHKGLTGSWTNGSYPFDIAKNDTDCGSIEPIEGAFLKFSFNKDGSYSKEWGSSTTQFNEIGIWEISADGEYVLLKAQSEDNTHESIKTYLAKIKMVDMDMIVLEQSLVSPDTENTFCTKNKDFLFVK